MGPDTAATTPVSIIMTFNTHPTKAAIITGGNIGLTVLWAALFNATEGQPAHPLAAMQPQQRHCRFPNHSRQRLNSCCYAQSGKMYKINLICTKCTLLP